MSEPLKYVIAVGGFAVIALVHVIVSRKTAERDARKEIAKLTPPTGVSLGDIGTRWLTDRIVQRLQLSAVATGILSCALGAAFITLRDVPVVREVGPMYFMFAWVVGYVIGSTIATASSARTGATDRRSATLAVRTLRTYLRPWERSLQGASLAGATVGVVIAGWLWFDDALNAFFLGIAATWLATLGLLILLQRWVLRTPPVVDEDLHVARELLISISVRTFAVYQLVCAGFVTFVGATYVSLHSDLAWIATMAPLYAVGAVGLFTRLARSNRRDLGLPAPEWHFARTLETSS